MNYVYLIESNNLEDEIVIHYLDKTNEERHLRILKSEFRVRAFTHWLSFTPATLRLYSGSFRNTVRLKQSETGCWDKETMLELADKYK